MAEKPLIAILMAVYEPRLDWLREQLLSLEEQTYPNLRLYVLDDASLTVPFEEIEACVRDCVRSFPVSVERAEENGGSNAAFERLCRDAEGEFFAFCDQDDVWLPEKLSVGMSELENTGALMICSDMTIIDENGVQTAGSITEIRRRHVFRSGEGLWDTLWYANFASGCAMLVRADEVRRALPFDPYMEYDQYIALCCAARGSIASLPAKLLRHREHGGNQTSLLRGVTDRESYYRIRVERKLLGVEWLCEHMDDAPQPLKDTLLSGRDWLRARLCYGEGERRCAPELWKNRRLAPLATALELALPWLPDAALRAVLALARRNLI